LVPYSGAHNSNGEWESREEKEDLLNFSAIGVAARHHSPMRVNGHHGHSASGNSEGKRRQDNDLLHGGSVPVVELHRAPDWTAML
jgi:hypothetical protein